MKVAAIILAAGASRRLGRPKQDVCLGGTTLLHRAVRTALHAGLSPVLVVVSEPNRMEALRALGASGVLHTQACEGMGSSIREGVAALCAHDPVSGAVLMTCDQPLLSAEHLHALCARVDRPCASRYAGRNGIPAYFPASWFAQLAEFGGDQGARSLLLDAEVVRNEDLAWDVDTEEDLRALQQSLGERSI